MTITLLEKSFTWRLLLVPVLAGSLVLTGCGSDNDNVTEGDNASTDGGGTDGGATDNGGTDGDNANNADGTVGKAIVTAIASDWTSSAVEIYNTTEPRDGVINLNPGVSDTAVRALDDKYFVIRKFKSDSITAHLTNDPSTVIFESSTNDGTDTRSGNPYDLVFVDSQKAYLLRYGNPVVWIVNPSATTAAEFKTGEIDLSAYDTIDGIPEAAAGVIVDDRLFVLMQRQERVPRDDGFENFIPARPGYIAVIDTTTDTEIDTGSDGELKGIQLPANNPVDLSLDTATNSIFVAAVGDYGSAAASRDPAFTGGVVVVDTTDYSTNLLVDDTEDTGRITAVEVIDANTAYMITETDFLSSTLVKFNPGTGSIITTGAAGYSAMDIREIAKGPAGNLWVGLGDAVNPKIAILNPADDTPAAAEINTSLIPAAITFAK